MELDGQFWALQQRVVSYFAVNYGLERINTEMAAWMRADEDGDGSKATPPYIAMGGPHSILWNRTFGQEVFKTQYERYHACSMVKDVLSKLGAKRLVIGHTPQVMTAAFGQPG